MTTLTREQTFPYDVRLSEQMERLGGARRQAERTPIDYSRLGGMALAKRGEMLGSFYGAALKAKGERDLQEQQRRGQWAEAGARKEAATLRAQAEAAQGLVTGLGKIGMGAASEAAAGTGPKAEAFREFLTKAYAGRWNPKTNTWAGWASKGEAPEAGTTPTTPTTPTATPVTPVTPVTPTGLQAEASDTAPAAGASGAITFPNDSKYEYQKIDGVWRTRKQGATDWIAYPFPQWQINKFEAAIAGR